MVRRGMYWRIGDGESVKVWKDAWVPGNHSRRIISPRGDYNPELEVGALIHPITRSWNMTLIKELFLPFEQDQILSIPLSHHFPKDTFFWLWRRMGFIQFIPRIEFFLGMNSGPQILHRRYRILSGTKFGVQLCCLALNYLCGGCVTMLFSNSNGLEGPDSGV